jgi:hypothetical protein
VFTLSSPGCPDDEFCRAHVPPLGCPSASRSAPSCSVRVPSKWHDSVARSPEPAKLASSAGLPDDETGPSHGPRSHENRPRPAPEGTIRRDIFRRRVLDTQPSNILATSRLPARSRRLSLRRSPWR